MVLRLIISKMKSLRTSISLSIFHIVFVSNLSSAQTLAIPEILKIEPTDENSTAVTIQWLPPKGTDGQIEGYIILYSKNKTLNDRKWAKKKVNGDVTTTIVDGLSPYTNYFFKIKARIGQELSPASQVEEFTTSVMKSLAVPKISKVVHLPDPRKVTVHFLPPREPNGHIKGYYIFYSQDASLPDEEWEEIYISGDVTSGVLDNLSPRTTYFIKIQVETDRGLGMSTSSPVGFTTREGPIVQEFKTKPVVIKSQHFVAPEMTKVELLTDPTRAILHFLPPTKPRGQIKGYYVFYSQDAKSSDEKWDKIYVDGDVTSVELDNLTPRKTYFIKMQVKTDEGLGPFTQNVAKFNTKQALVADEFGTKPEANNKSNNNEQLKSSKTNPSLVESQSSTTPSIVEVVPSPYDETVVTLKWSPSKELNGQIIGYYIFYSKDVRLPDLKWDIEFVKGVQTTTQLILEPNCKYFFKIQVKTDEDLSSLSEVFEFRPDNS